MLADEAKVSTIMLPEKGLSVRRQPMGCTMVILSKKELVRRFNSWTTMYVQLTRVIT